MDENKQKDLIKASKDVLETSEILWRQLREKDELIALLKEENSRLVSANALLNFKNNELSREIILMKGIYLDY